MKQSRKNGVKVAIAISIALGAGAQATENKASHYPNGSEHFMLAYMPPPGVYYLGHLIHYDADKLRDNGGNALPVNFSQKVQGIVPRIVWVTKNKVLGGQLAFHGYAPLLKVDVDMLGMSQSKSGLGDVVLGGAVGYNPTDELHYLIGVDVTAPTGEYDANDLANLGRNYWSLRPQAAFTYLQSEGLNADIKFMYDFNRRNTKTNYRSGQEFHVDYSIGWGFSSSWIAGVSGYYYQQTTDDRVGGTTIKGNRGRVLGLGPSLKFDNGYGWVVTAAYQKEMNVRNRPSGNAFHLKMLLPF